MSRVPKFCEDLKAKLSGLRLKHPGTVRIIPDDKQQRVRSEISFYGTGASLGTMEFAAGYREIEQYPDTVLDHFVDMVEKDMESRGLLITRMDSTGKRLRYRVVQVAREVSTQQPNSMNLLPPTITVRWEGDDPTTCKLKLGVIDRQSFPNTEVTVTNVLQSYDGQSWIDIPPPSRAVSPAGPQHPIIADAMAALAQAAFTPDPSPTPTELKRKRAEEARERSGARKFWSVNTGKPVAITEVVRGPGEATDYDIEDARKQHEIEEAQRQREEERRRTAAERLRREEEERKRRQRIHEAAVASWKKSSGLIASCASAWEAAALHEAELRSKQVEADLFGGMDDHIDAGEKWIDAEEAARALLTFAQERLEEAQARREGKGFEAVFGEEVEDTELAQAQAQAGQEHVDESEFAEVAKERVGAELKKALEEDEPSPPSEPPETGDEAIDELMGKTGT